MAKLRVTFDVDCDELFDSIAKMDNDWTPLVQRMAGVMMTGKASFRDAVGMKVYGVEVASVQRTDLQQPTTE